MLYWLDPERLIERVREHWQRAGSIAATLGCVSRSGFALLGCWPTSCCCRCWRSSSSRDWTCWWGAWAPPTRDYFEPCATARESGAVLGSFLRGRLLVMLILGVLYGVGL